MDILKKKTNATWDLRKTARAYLRVFSWTPEKFYKSQYHSGPTKARKSRTSARGNMHIVSRARKTQKKKSAKINRARHRVPRLLCSCPCASLQSHGRWWDTARSPSPNGRHENGLQWSRRQPLCFGTEAEALGRMLLYEHGGAGVAASHVDGPR